METSDIVSRQRQYFLTGATRPLNFRLNALKKLYEALQASEQELCRALKADLGKSGFESYMTETGFVLSELRHHIKQLPKWMKDRRVKTPLSQLPAKSFVSAEPYGVALIMSPWNYPLQLCLEPLIGAVSAGNCAVVKPSAYAPRTSAAVAKLLSGLFPPEYICVVEGGREENSLLLQQRFDYIFFTGSVAVGKAVMEAASRNLTPVTLELGGKSPVIVDETADLRLAARRIAFGKLVNAGQTCVAPDYLLIHRSVKDEFILRFEETLREFFPGGDMGDVPCIINDRHFNRLLSLMSGEKAVIGGGCDAARRFIEPTILDGVSPDSPIMREEIFGPVLPVLSYDRLGEAIAFIRERQKPLALYLFTGSAEAEEKVLNGCSFGGGCINDTIVHLAGPHMPFGGVGESGMGAYHGKASFDTFSHRRSIMKKSNLLDLKMRYHPYTDKKLSIVRRFLK